MTERNAGAGQGDEQEPTLPADEEAAWAQIVAAYGDEPADEPGPEPGDERPDAERAAERSGREDDAGGRGAAERARDGEARDGEADARDGDAAAEPGDDRPARSFTVYSPGAGPRDWRPPEERDGEDDEGHFVPPEPPPLPETDPTTRFAWLAALGGPLLLVGAVLFRVDMTWWIVTLGVGGFLGGFLTLVTRMRDGRDDDDYDDPGRGAVV